MWKNYNRYYTQILKSEVGSIYQSRNINQIPSVEKISLTCVSNNPNSTKSILMILSAIQLVINKKARIVTAQDSIIMTKVRKGQPLGGKNSLTNDSVWLFLNFLTFNIMPLLDLTKFMQLKKTNNDFSFFIKSSAVFNKLKPFFNFYQFLPSIQVLFTLKNSTKIDKIFLLRLLKLPVLSKK